MVRPRDVSLPPDEMIKLGEEMLEWVKLNKPLHLSQWYTIEKMYTYNEWKQFITKAEFHPYYEKALKLVGIQYLDKTSNIRDSISQRWQRVYFKDLKEEEDQTADEEVKRKQAIAASQQSQTTYIMVPNDLSVGTKVSPKTLPDSSNQSPE